MAEPPSRQLRHCRTACRDQRSQDQRDLVAHTTGRVLVDGRTADTREVEPFARVDHRPGPNGELAGLHPLEVDRHAERGGLLVGDLALRVRVDEPAELRVGEPLAVTLRLDDLDHVHRHISSSALRQSLGVERSGQDVAHRAHRAVAVDQEVRAAGLPEQLPAAAARHDGVAQSGACRHRDESPSPAGVQRRDQPALRAQREAVRPRSRRCRRRSHGRRRPARQRRRGSGSTGRTPAPRPRPPPHAARPSRSSTIRSAGPCARADRRPRAGAGAERRTPARAAS